MHDCRVWLIQASVQQEKEDVQKARGLHEMEVQRHREQLAQMNANIDHWKVVRVRHTRVLSSIMACMAKGPLHQRRSNRQSTELGLFLDDS